MRPLDDALLARMEDKARTVAALIDRAVRDLGSRSVQLPRRMGFALLVFSFDGPEMTWISNANRDDMVRALKEMIAKFESGAEDELHAKDRIPE